MTERHIELTWRCSSCGVSNLGRHMACTGCGNPKDDSEEYEMPADPSAVADVTDPALLRMAEAGANWSCAYCGSDQRDLDGGCRRCGAGRSEGANVPKPLFAGAPSPYDLDPDPVVRPVRSLAFWGALGMAFVLVVLAGTVILSWPKPRAERSSPPSVVEKVDPWVELDTKVVRASWKRTVHVERWDLVAHEGFLSELPSGALDVRPTGQKVHHTEQVFDHDETVYEDVEVPDGYRTESYTERVRCGEDCTTTPRTCKKVCTRSSRSCREVCTNKKNGFASCRQECSGGEERCRDDCSGGDRRCETRYCNETRTRQIPKTRHEKRAKKVARYRDEPRYAAFGTYRTWEWVPDHVEEESGEDGRPRWPDASARAARTIGDQRMPKKGDLREDRSESFAVTLRAEDGREWPYVPASADEAARFAVGTTVRVRVGPGDTMSILGPR